MKEEIIKALTIIEEEGRVERDIEIIHKAKEEIERLNSIIDKAIEYLTSTTHFVLEYDKPFRKLSKYEEQYEKREEDLLNILEGEDK